MPTLCTAPATLIAKKKGTLPKSLGKGLELRIFFCEELL